MDTYRFHWHGAAIDIQANDLDDALSQFFTTEMHYDIDKIEQLDSQGDVVREIPRRTYRVSTEGTCYVTSVYEVESYCEDGARDRYENADYEFIDQFTGDNCGDECIEDIEDVTVEQEEPEPTTPPGFI